ncbi:MAG: efflux RND transporter periplasmic adaptor subunit [Pseudomonadota bacterium]|nr:efflux RND transporter periplasmic adaptor subunit [Pseudomonadota bacterium]
MNAGTPPRPRRGAMPWVLLAVLLTLALLGWRGWQARQAVSQSAAPAAAPVAELAPQDLARAQVRELVTSLPITGTLAAVRTATVKARVPGELQALNVREGDTVHAGQVLARIAAPEHGERLRQAQLQADAARAQADIAQRQHDNNAALVQRGFISQTALDHSRASLEAARATHRAAQAAAEVARQSVADAVLRAPIDGQIAQRLAQPGERVVPEARIVEIVDLSELELQAPLSPADSVAVRVGQLARLHVEGLPDAVNATVARINPSAQAGSRSVLVYLRVVPQPGLRQGLFAQGELATGQVRALAVPLGSVRTDKPLPYVQVVEGGCIAHHTVETGTRAAADGETWVAVTGVPEGAQVLRASAGALREGTPVKVLAEPTPAGSAPHG